MSRQSLQMGRCTLCGRESACVCDRCRDYYCSPECQKIDWPRHRYICFPMPSLVSISHLDNESRFDQKMPVLAATFHSNGSNNASGNGSLQSPLHRNANTSESKLNELIQNISNKSSPQSSYNNDIKKDNMHDGSNNSLAGSIKRTGAQSKVVPPAAKMPSAKSIVSITGFHSTNRCYIRPANVEDDIIYRAILDKCNEYGNQAPPLQQVPPINSYVMANANGKWFRGQVVNNKQGLKITFLDLGTSFQRHEKHLRQICDEILEFPLYAYLVQLHNVANCKRTEKTVAICHQYESKKYIVDYFESDAYGTTVNLTDCLTKKLLNDEFKTVFQCSELYGNGQQKSTNTNGRSDLKNRQDNDLTNSEKKISRSIASDDEIGEAKKGITVASVHSPPSKQQQVAESKHDDLLNKIQTSASAQSSQRNTGQSVASARPGPPKQVATPVMKPPFEFHYLDQSQKDISVIVMDTSCLEYGYIGVLPTTARQHFNNIHTYLQKYKDNDFPSYKPKEDEYCLAKYRGEWFRAKVLEVAGNEYNVVYIDFTNEGLVKNDDIRRYPRDLTIDCYTILCLIHGIPKEPSPKELDILKRFFENKKELIINNVRSKNESVLYVDCDVITQQLKHLN